MTGAEGLPTHVEMKLKLSPASHRNSKQCHMDGKRVHERCRETCRWLCARDLRTLDEGLPLYRF